MIVTSQDSQQSVRYLLLKFINNGIRRTVLHTEKIYAKPQSQKKPKLMEESE